MIIKEKDRGAPWEPEPFRDWLRWMAGSRERIKMEPKNTEEAVPTDGTMFYFKETQPARPP